MFKKLSVIIFIVFIMLGTSACNIKKDGGTGFGSDNGVVTTTEKPTYHYNRFKDRIPKLDFKETPEEQYIDGESYFFTVNCSEKEFEKYVKSLKKNGFENNLVEATGYFYAKDSEGYFAELVYKNGILTATIDR